ncbi:MAG: NAD-dependent epimerase [Pseudomonas sp.]|nr:NAD-dependent epimerase [Pseudomonas sp.]
MAKILVTGAAGFIGSCLAKKLTVRGDEVVGLDNINDYYDVRVKYGRLQNAGIIDSGKNVFGDVDLPYNEITQSKTHKNYSFIKLNLEDTHAINDLFKKCKFDSVCNLAAQAGVRYSLENPMAYINSNIVGFANILEACRHNSVKSIAYASSSSVYGLNEQYPFSTESSTDHPMSFYAASKKANEVMAHSYSHLYGLPTTGLRFFTVYGPWGRPDMALYLFTKAIINGEPINVFNNGDMLRDFTFVDDIVNGVIKVIDNPAQPSKTWDPANPTPSSSSAPFKVYNIGNNNPVKLIDFITALEDKIGKKAEKIMMPIQPGDVPATYADVQSLVDDFDYKPSTTVKDGINRFVDWYVDFFNVEL